MMEEKQKTNIQKLIKKIKEKDALLLNAIHEEQKIFNDIKSSKRYSLGNKIVSLLGTFFKFLNINHDNTFEKASRVVLTKKKLMVERSSYLSELLSECGLSNTIQESGASVAFLYHPILNSVIDKIDYSLFQTLTAFSNEELNKITQTPLSDSPLVSVIMPTHNRADVIHEAIASVLNQTYKNYELIIIDDGSTDNTEALISNLDHLKINYHRQKKSGVSAARNKGLELSNGEYIAYLDSDNTWHPHFLEVFVKKFNSDTSILCAFCGQNILEGNEITGVAVNNFYPRILENRNYIDLNIFVHHRSLYEKLGGFDNSLSRLVDWDFIYRYTNFSSPVLIPIILCDYYVGKVTNQISSTSNYKTNLKRLKKTFQGDVLDQDITNFLPKKFRGNLYHDKMTSANQLIGKKVSIIIPSYEVLACLQAAVLAIEKYTPQECYELIIVDNNSSTPVKNYLLELEASSRAKTILNEENMGFSYAVNQGIKISEKSNDIILFNNDAIVTKGWLQAIYECHATQDKIGLVVPSQILPKETKTLNTHVPFADPEFEVDVNLSVHHSNIVSPLRYNGKQYVEVSFAAFFCVFISRECFEELGYLDHVNGRHYKSDRLYCELAHKKGWKIIYTPYAKVYHLLQQATTNLKTDQTKYKTMFENNAWEKTPPQLFDVE